MEECQSIQEIRLEQSMDQATVIQNALMIKNGLMGRGILLIESQVQQIQIQGKVNMGHVVLKWIFGKQMVLLHR